MKHPIKTVRAIDRLLLRPEQIAASTRQADRSVKMAARKAASSVRTEKKNGPRR